MPRPASKVDLIDAAKTQYEKMFKLIHSMTEEEQNAPFKFDCTGKKEVHWLRDKNLRDVLVHLYEWHGLLLNWVAANRRGESKPFLPEPYNWKTYGDMNVGFWEKHQDTPYEKATEMLVESHQEVMKLIEGFTDEELFTKNKIPWVGGTTLGSYCVSATSGHYDWAMKKIKMQIKAIK